MIKGSNRLEFVLDQPEIILRGMVDEASGAIFSGILVAHLTEPIRVKGLKMVLSGHEHLEWDYREDSMPSTFHRDTVPITHTWSFFSTSNGRKTETWDAGRHEFPFSLVFPGNLPESVSIPYANVSYQLKATLRRSGIMSNITAKREVLVKRDLTMDGGFGAGAIDVDNRWRNMLDFHISADADTFVPGDELTAKFTFQPLVKNMHLTKIGTMLKEYVRCHTPLGEAEKVVSRITTFAETIPSPNPSRELELERTAYIDSCIQFVNGRPRNISQAEAPAYTPRPLDDGMHNLRLSSDSCEGTSSTVLPPPTFDRPDNNDCSQNANGRDLSGRNILNNRVLHSATIGSITNTNNTGSALHNSSQPFFSYFSMFPIGGGSQSQPTTPLAHPSHPRTIHHSTTVPTRGKEADTRRAPTAASTPRAGVDLTHAVTESVKLKIPEAMKRIQYDHISSYIEITHKLKFSIHFKDPSGGPHTLWISVPVSVVPVVAGSPRGISTELPSYANAALDARVNVADGAEPPTYDTIISESVCRAASSANRQQRKSRRFSISVTDSGSDFDYNDDGGDGHIIHHATSLQDPEQSSRLENTAGTVSSVDRSLMRSNSDYLNRGETSRNSSSMTTTTSTSSIYSHEDSSTASTTGIDELRSAATSSAAAAAVSETDTNRLPEEIVNSSDSAHAHATTTQQQQQQQRRGLMQSRLRESRTHLAIDSSRPLVHPAALTNFLSRPVVFPASAENTPIHTPHATPIGSPIGSPQLKGTEYTLPLPTNQLHNI